MSSPDTPNAVLRNVPCPGCGNPTPYRMDNPYRPFCSERCKDIDFGAWASESFRLQADAPPDDDGSTPRE